MKTDNSPEQAAGAESAPEKEYSEELQARIARFNERKQARIDRLYARAQKKRDKVAGNDLSLFGEAKSGIPMGQPILVGHHSERRHRRHLERIERKVRQHYEENKAADRLESRAESAASNDAIMSNDPEAVIKMREKIAEIKKSNEYGKKINKLMKPHGTIEAALLHFSKLTDEDSVFIVKHLSSRANWYASNRIGLWFFSTTNNTAEIRRLEKRIEAQARIETGFINFSVGSGPKEIKVELVDGQIQVQFPGKPSDECRQVLKRSPLVLKWSRYSGRWVRKHTPATAGRYFIEELRKCLELEVVR